MPIKPITGVSVPRPVTCGGTSTTSTPSLSTSNHITDPDTINETIPPQLHLKPASPSYTYTRQTKKIETNKQKTNKSSPTTGFHVPAVRRRDLFYAKLEDERAASLGQA
ncbi:hypothetical protein E4T39_01600 [Aureobasidium subglaciale]|nr:hypothetical protein E4T39_01600 [Aureobasidium subglaciale]